MSNQTAFNKRHFWPGLFIPTTLSGVTALCGLLVWRFADMQAAEGIVGGVIVIALIVFMSVLTGGLAWLMMGRLLRALDEFVAHAEEVPAVRAEQVPVSRERQDEFSRYTSVFGRVAGLLDKVQAVELFPEIVAASESMRAVLGQLCKVAPTDTGVLVTGESGTGKELVCRAVHRLSGRREKPLVAVNCMAIPDGLLESELFGHEKGAFTGATGRRLGRFVEADGGTIFLDEIGDMPLELQGKLLRVLQEGEVLPVGGSPRRVNVRVVAATNRDLGAMVTEGAFREDLFYRLNVFPVHLPPLRERPEDIVPLAALFMSRQTEACSLSAEAEAELLGHSWPGNVRELRNVLEGASVVCGEDGIIRPDHLLLPRDEQGRVVPAPEFEAATGSGTGQSGKPLDDCLAELERTLIERALRRTDGVQVRAAELLGIKERSLWHRLKKHGIQAAAYKKHQ